MSNSLTTAEAATRMGISEEAVRVLCRNGQLRGATQDRARGPWRIPESAVDAWVAQNGQPIPPPRPNSPNPGPDPDPNPNPNPNPDPNPDPNQEDWTKKIQEMPWFQIVLILGAIATALTIGPAIGDSWDWIQSWLPTEPPFASENENEVLIVIANFHYTEGIAHTEAHHEIRQAIEEKANEFDFTNLRVEVEPTSLRAEAREEAEALGQQYNTMRAWSSGALTAEFV